MPITKKAKERVFLQTNEEYLKNNPFAIEEIAQALDDIDTAVVYKSYQMVTVGRSYDGSTPQMAASLGQRNWINFQGSCIAEALVNYWRAVQGEAEASPPPLPPLKRGAGSTTK